MNESLKGKNLRLKKINPSMNTVMPDLHQSSHDRQPTTVNRLQTKDVLLLSNDVCQQTSINNPSTKDDLG